MTSSTWENPSPSMHTTWHKPIPHLWNKQQAEDDCYSKEDPSSQHPIAGLGLHREQDANGDQRDAGQDRAVHGQCNEAGIVEGLNVDCTCLKCEENSHPQVNRLIDEEDGKHNGLAVRRAREDHIARQLQNRSMEHDSPAVRLWAGKHVCMRF